MSAAAAAAAVPAAAASEAVVAAAAAAAVAPPSKALSAALSQLPALSAKLTERFTSNAEAARRMFLGNYATAQAAVPTTLEEKR